MQVYLPALCYLLVAWTPLVIADVTQFLLEIEPPQAYIRTGENVTVMCRATVPLSQCQLFVAKSYYDASHVTAERGVTYKGRGLKLGHCGFNIQGDVFTEDNTYAVSCRARTDYSDWVYAVMVIHKNSEVHGNFLDNQRVRVVKPGNQVRVVYKVESIFSTCEMYDNRASQWLDLTAGECSIEGNLCGLGDKLECGFTISNVTDWNNQQLWLAILGEGREGLLHDFIILVVAEPPATVELTMNLTTTGDGGQKLTAECVVKKARPQANISWFLGDEHLTASEVRNIPTTLNVRSWSSINGFKATRQRMVRNLDYTEWGKDLWCRAEHFLLPQGLSSNRVKIENSLIPERYCPSLKSNSVNIMCYLGTVKKNCHQPQRVGTTARLQCKPGYTVPQSVFYREIYCLESGRWNKDIFMCFTDCGRRRSSSAVQLISNGVPAVVGEFPWHVGIYRFNGTGFQHACGGSLITDQVVITAAHCFWDNINNVAHNESQFRVVAGKIRRSWEDKDTGMQRREISRIDTNHFGGIQTSLAYDIALVFLKQPVEINDIVNVICIDMENLVELTHFQDGNIGIVPGWGVTEKGSQSETLRYIMLPYISHNVCYATLPVYDRPLLTSDKFCAGYRNQSKSVCGGDSGGGLAFLETEINRYYLRGIVSIAFKSEAPGTTACYSNQYTAFTRLTQDYLRWIQRST